MTHRDKLRLDMYLKYAETISSVTSRHIGLIIAACTSQESGSRFASMAFAMPESCGLIICNSLSDLDGTPANKYRPVRHFPNIPTRRNEMS